MKARIKLSALVGIAFAIFGCGAAPTSTVQPLSSAAVEVAQGTSGGASASSAVQPMTPQLPPKGPDGGPL